MKLSAHEEMQISERVRFYDYHPAEADLRAEVVTGLSQSHKTLPPKLFYDQRGSQLFDAITELPEYYPTRSEIALLREHGAEMAGLLGREAVLVELGSGSSLKIRTLLTALQPRVYIPVDISRAHLIASARTLAEAFPQLMIRATCADYSNGIALPLEADWCNFAGFFPGSSIGNFHPPEALELLRRVARTLGSGGRLLIGVDLIKARTILEAAYNDAQGVTAAFNLNLLERLNRELAGDFDLESFDHHAVYNAAGQRIEMHLVSRRAQQVRVAGERFDFVAGESILTECSYKFTIAAFQDLARAAGYVPEAVWSDARGLFSVHCLRVAAGEYQES